MKKQTNKMNSLFFCVLQLDQKAKEDLIEGMRDYDTNPGLKKSWDSMQRIVRGFNFPLHLSSG